MKMGIHGFRSGRFRYVLARRAEGLKRSEIAKLVGLSRSFTSNLQNRAIYHRTDGRLKSDYPVAHDVYLEFKKYYDQTMRETS